jgi:hypothetical protein
MIQVIGRDEDILDRCERDAKDYYLKFLVVMLFQLVSLLVEHTNQKSKLTLFS